MTSESSFGEKIFNCHIGMGSILLLQLSYCHTYKISPQNYKKDWEYTPKEQKYYNKVSAVLSRMGHETR